MSRKEYIRKKVLEHLIGPAGSIVLHIFIIYAAIHFIVFETREGTQEVEVQVMEMETVDLDDLLEELEDDFEPLDFDLDFEMPDMDVDMDTPPDMEDFAQEQPEMDFAALDVMMVDSPLVMQGLFSGRTSDGRAELLNRYGGRWGEMTAAAVLRALEWLRINQREDGSWEHQNAPSAMTGLGLLTFLAHGETPSSERYGRTVRRAINYLLDQQRDDGNFQQTGGNHVYGNAIAAYALTEAYALTRIPRLKEPMDRAIQVMIDEQQPNGGWDYNWNQGPRRDASVSAFIVQALKAAELAGSSADGIHEAMESSIRDLRDHQNRETGAFVYGDNLNQNHIGMAAIGSLLHQLTGHGRSQEARAGIDFVRQNASVDWDDPGRWAMYRWYYITQVMFQTGGTTWDRWNNQFAPAFVRNQNEDGSWTSPSGQFPEGGGGREVTHGPVYSTTFAALSLQVYYRILPTFAVVEEPVQEEEDDDDVVITII